MNKFLHYLKLYFTLFRERIIDLWYMLEDLYFDLKDLYFDLKKKIFELKEKISNSISNFLIKIVDYFIYTSIPKTINFFWYFNLLERLFDLIEHVCYYYIKIPYEKFTLYMDTVVLPPIREKYNKWLTNKHMKYRLFKRKKRIEFYKFFKLNFERELNFFIKFKAFLYNAILNLFMILFNSKIIYFNIILLKIIKYISLKIYESAKDEIDEIIKDPDVEFAIHDVLFEYGWAWYPMGLSIYQLAFIVYVVWLRYQFFYDTHFAANEFSLQRVMFVIKCRRALFENNEMWGNAYSTASISSDSYYNAYYDKENKFRATHLFYDRYILGPTSGFKSYTWNNQGSTVLHWGSLVNWERQSHLKIYNLASCFFERTLPEYYYKKTKLLVDEVSRSPDYFSNRKLYKYKELLRSYPQELLLLKDKKFKKFGPSPFTIFIFDYYNWNYTEDELDDFHDEHKIDYYFNNHWKIHIPTFSIHNFNSVMIERMENYAKNYFIHFNSFDTYSSMLGRGGGFKSPYWFLNLNKNVALLMYYKNDFYGLFKNPYLGCALKNFFVFEQIYSYILSNLNEMTFNEAVARRYTSESFNQDWFFPYWLGASYRNRSPLHRSCFWENYIYFGSTSRWRGFNVSRSRFWSYRAHLGTLLWPAYNGETDTSYWAVKNYLYSFAYNYRPYYYYFNLIHYFYREIFGHMWIFGTLAYWGFISVAAEIIHKSKEDKYYSIYKHTEIKELDYLIRASFWISAYRVVYFFLIIILSFYFMLDYYSCKNTFISVYYNLLTSIREYQELNDLYCEFNDYGFGEDFLMLAMSPEFSNYSDVAKRFFKDPFLVAEIDLYENSFRRRDIGFEYEYFMGDNYFFLRSYTSNNLSDTIFYKKWWAFKFSETAGTDFLIEEEIWPYIFGLNYYSHDYYKKIFPKFIKIINKIKTLIKDYNTIYGTLDERSLKWKEIFSFIYLKFFLKKDFYVDETFDINELLIKKIEKNFYDYHLLHKPFFGIYYKNYEVLQSAIKDYDNTQIKKPFMEKYFDDSLELNYDAALIEERSNLIKCLNNASFKIFWKKDLNEYFYNKYFKDLFNLIDVEEEIIKLRKLDLKNAIVDAFIYKYSPSPEAYYNSYLMQPWFIWKKESWPFYKTCEDDLSVALKWCNVLNPFSRSLPNFYPHLYFEEDWYQVVLKNGLFPKYNHALHNDYKNRPQSDEYEYWYRQNYLDSWEYRSKTTSDKIKQFQRFLKFPYIMSQRISKSLLYLEVISRLDQIDLENLQNIRLNHEASRTTFSRKYYKTIKKHLDIYFNAAWVYGPWDERAIRLDNAISDFCHYYCRAGRYHNLNRMCLYINGVKKFREEQWFNREIPAPPNHMVEDALWYRFVPAFYKLGMGVSRVNIDWFIYSGVGLTYKEGINHFKIDPEPYMTCSPFMYFLTHTKNIMFYTFNPKKDIIQGSNFNLGTVPNILSFFNPAPEYTVFSSKTFIESTEMEEEFAERVETTIPDDPNFIISKDMNLQSVDTKPFNFFKNDTLLKYNPVQALNFNLFQFLFSSYFGRFADALLTDYFENKNELLENFEIFLLANDTVENIDSRLRFYQFSDLTGFNALYPIQCFGFFPLDPRVKDFDSDEFILTQDFVYYSYEIDRLNKFFKIEEISPSWSKIVLTMENIKDFHEIYEKLSWLNLLKSTEQNNAYWFYFLYKSSIVIFFFINILFYFNKILIKSISAFKYKKINSGFYKIGFYLNQQGILNAIAENIYTYWTYWFVFFIVFQLFFWIDEFFTFVIWVNHSMPFVIDFIFN